MFTHLFLATLWSKKENIQTAKLCVIWDIYSDLNRPIYPIHNDVLVSENSNITIQLFIN